MASNKSVVLLILISLLYIPLSFYVYRDTSGHGFLYWDDVTYVSGNAHVQKINAGNLWWMLTKYHANNWHPLSWLSHAIDVTIWGNNPARHHQTNIFIHSLNSILLFFVTLTLIRVANNKNDPVKIITSNNRAILASFMTGLLFLIHPQHVESVAWIAERKDLLCALFFMLSILAYIHFTLTGKSSLKTTSVLLYIFSLMSKSMAVSLPFVLLLLDYFPLKRLGNHDNPENNLIERIKEKSIYFFAAIATALITLITQYTSGAVRTLDELSLPVRLLNAANSLIFYGYRFLVPTDFSAYYPYPDWILHKGLLSLIPVLAIIIIMAILIKACRNGHPIGLISFIYYLVTILPVIGIIQVGTQAAADRYTYIPLMAFYILAGLFIQKLHENFSKNPWLKIPLYLLLAGAFYFLVNKSHEQVLIWKNDKTLWKSVLLKYPDTAPVAHANLGSVYFEEGKFSLAEAEYNRAISINPKDINSLLNLGLTLERLHKKEQAIKLYNKVASENSDSFRVLTETGNAFFRLHKYKMAYSQFIRALELNPGSDETIIQISRIQALSGKYTAAQNLLLSLLKRSPDNINAIILMANIFAKQNIYGMAIQYYKKALLIKPENKHAKQRLNALMKTTR
ncbi:MAG TPA: tetratricopeptide repeat protein [Gammaproteobacteria bacterium]|nr:tetratricopeptide repeat protein [Gammaproteobacteria bacterium]